MPLSEHSPRVGRSQGTIIFWGLISVCFAAAACYYFWKNDENEAKANRLRDENLILQSQLDQITAEKKKLQTSISDTEGRLKAREDLLQEKENKLADVESHLGTAPKVPAPVAPPPAPIPPSPAGLLKRFNDSVHKIDADASSGIISRDQRQLFRVSNSFLFAPGEATLKPDGRTFLNQFVQSLKGQTNDWEIHIECFTDTDAEPPKTLADGTPTKPKYAGAWELTSARSVALSRFFHEQGSLPPQNLLIIARGDSLPASSGKDNRSLNRRVEISLTPLATVDNAPLAPPPDTPAPAAQKPN